MSLLHTCICTARLSVAMKWACCFNTCWEHWWVTRSSFLFKCPVTHNWNVADLCMSKNREQVLGTLQSVTLVDLLLRLLFVLLSNKNSGSIKSSRHICHNEHLPYTYTRTTQKIISVYAYFKYQNQCMLYEQIIFVFYSHIVSQPRSRTKQFQATNHAWSNVYCETVEVFLILYRLDA